MGSVHARGDTFLTFGLKALTETNTSRLATVSWAEFTGHYFAKFLLRYQMFLLLIISSGGRISND
jgi:hypothetical protein